MSVREIKGSEIKLKLMSFLSLKSASFGHISIAQFNQDCLAASSQNCEDVSLVADQFSGALHDVSVDSVSEDDMHVLVFIAGYVGRKLKQSLSCTACINELLSPDDMSCDVKTDNLVYVHALDRGGLKWPRQALVDIVTLIFCLFQRLLCNDYEKQFIAVPNHKQLGVYLSVELLHLNYFLTVCAKLVMTQCKMCLSLVRVKWLTFC